MQGSGWRSTHSGHSNGLGRAASGTGEPHPMAFGQEVPGAFCSHVPAPQPGLGLRTTVPLPSAEVSRAAGGKPSGEPWLVRNYKGDSSSLETQLPGNPPPRHRPLPPPPRHRPLPPGPPPSAELEPGRPAGLRERPLRGPLPGHRCHPAGRVRSSCYSHPKPGPWHPRSSLPDPTALPACPPQCPPSFLPQEPAPFSYPFPEELGPWHHHHG